MSTIEDVSRNRGHTSGFDYLQLVLSTSVIAWHTVAVCYGQAAQAAFWAGHLRPLIMFIIPSFFALSGFLVAGSLQRNSLPAFLALRLIRIVPALAVETLLSALLIGPLVTTYDLRSYFSNPLFGGYFLNVLGYVHFQLPGVFANMPTDKVNGQLWTIPYELECYIAISLLAGIGLVSRPRFIFSLLAVFIAFSLIYHSISGGWPAIDDGPPGRMIVMSFLFGASLYFLRAVIPYNLPVLICSLAISAISLSGNKTLYVAALPVAYVTIYVGLLNPKRIFLIRQVDYSYGLFLFGFPIQQIVIFALPGWRFPLANFLIAWPLTFICAWLSWHLVETKFLDRKKMVVDAINAWLSRVSQYRRT